MSILHGTLTAGDGAHQVIRFGLTHANATQLRRVGRTIPPPVEVSALIDTGAEVTCIDPSVTARLGLQAKDLELTNAPGVAGLSFCWRYDVDVVVVHPNGLRSDHLSVSNLEVLELPLNTLGYDAILGRDVLASCVLIYDGTAGSFTLSY